MSSINSSPKVGIIRVGTINAQSSLARNIDTYADLFDHLQLDILCIQDTGKTPPLPFFATQTKCIAVLINPPPKKDKAGGLAWFVREAIKPFIHTSKIHPKSHRIWTIELSSPFDISISNCYAQARNKVIRECILECELRGKSILCGDLNSITNKQIDAFSTCTNTQRHYTPIKELLDKGWIDTFRMMNPGRAVFSRIGTYEREGMTHFSASRIDYVLTSPDLSQTVVNCKVVEEDKFFSDHRLVYADYKDINAPPLHTNEKKFKVRQGIKDKSKWAEFKDKLEGKALNKSPDKDLNESSTELTGKMVEVYNNVFPVKEVHSRDINKWMYADEDYIALKKAKRGAYKVIKYIWAVIEKRCEANLGKLMDLMRAINPCPLPFEANFSTAAITAAHKNENLISNKMKQIINRIKKEKINKKVTEIIQKIDIDGHNAFKLIREMDNSQINFLIEDDHKGIITDEIKITETLDREWAKIFATSRGENEDLDPFLENLVIPQKSPDNPDFSIENIKRILSGKSASSPGESETTWTMLKNAPDAYLAKLSEIYQVCFNSYTCPTKWKDGITVLLPKPDTLPTPTGFRPITLLSVEYKLYTHILNHTLLTWLLTNNAIPPSQNGALPERGCDTCLWALLTTIKAAKDNNLPLHLLYIDFAKAFDSVEHWALEKILTRLNAGKLGENIMGILRGSKTKLRVNNEVHQEEIDLQRGTKQGDVISPLLFIVFLCPLLWTLERKCKGFKWRDIKFNTAVIVDDIAFGTSTAEDAELGLQIVKDFSGATGMQINAKKSAYAFKNVDRPIFPIHNGIPFDVLGADKCYRYLGLWINLNLDWTKMLEKLKDSIWKGLEIITRKKYLTAHTICKLINATIYAKIGYRMQIVMMPTTWINEIEEIVWNKLLETAKYSRVCSIEGWQKFRGLKSLKVLNYERYLGSLDRNLVRTTNNIARPNILLYLRGKTQAPPIFRADNWTNPYVVVRSVGLDWVDRIHYTGNNNIFNDLPTLPEVMPQPAHTHKLIWTDGSLKVSKNEYQMSAAYVSHPFTDPTAFVVNGTPSSTEPELQAILNATLAYKDTEHLHIFTDSANAINMIRRVKEKPYLSFHKCPNATTLNAIKLALESRNLTVNIFPPTPTNNDSPRSININHVLSHSDKKKKSRIANEKKFKQWSAEIIKGNSLVDAAAEKARATNSSPLSILCKTSNPFKFFPVANPMRDPWVKLKEAGNGYICKNWKGKDGIKAERMLNPLIDQACTRYILANNNIKHRAMSNFTFKNMTATLPTKPTVTRSMWFKSDKIPAWKKNAYETKECSNCKKVERESHEHLFKNCEEVKARLPELEWRCLRIINDNMKVNFGSFPWWFGTRSGWTGSKEIQKPFNEFPEDLAFRGFIPIALRNYLSTIGNSVKVEKTIKKITLEICYNNFNIWSKRCKQLFKKPPAQNNSAHNNTAAPQNL